MTPPDAASEPERCHCGRYPLRPEQTALLQPTPDLAHTRTGCERPLTPAAQAVLEAALTWEAELTAGMPTLKDGFMLLADPLYVAIRRYRETLPP